MEAVRAALPGPSPASIAPVAGLLEGPDASDPQRKNDAILRQLAQIMNSRRAVDHEQQSEESRQHWESEAAKKREQDFRFPSFPRRRESSQPLKSLDTRFRGVDELTGLAKVLGKFRTC